MTWNLSMRATSCRRKVCAQRSANAPLREGSGELRQEGRILLRILFLLLRILFLMTMTVSKNG
jgi:hypothetical protein